MVPEPTYIAEAVRLPSLTADMMVVGRRRHADLSHLDAAESHSGWTAARVVAASLEIPSGLTDAYRESRDLLDVDDRSYRFMISAVLSTARDIFEETGGFDERFVSYGGEDWEFAHRAFTCGAVFAHERRAVAWHHGHDWASRGDPVARLSAKNAETLKLAQLVPDPALRGPGSWPPYPEVVVRLSGAASDAQALCVRGVLAGDIDVMVWVDEQAPALQHDPRVNAGAVPSDVARRARVVIDFAGPVRLPPGLLRRWCAEVAAPSPGQLRTSDGLVTVTASRALHRARRHSLQVSALFDVAMIAPVERLPTAVDVSRELRRLLPNRDEG